MTSARVVGPALAGLLIHTVGYGWCFLLDGLSYLAVIAGLWLMRTAELRPAPVTPRAKGQVRAGLRYVRRVPDLWIPLVMMAIVGTLAFNFQVVIPLLVRRELRRRRRHVHPALLGAQPRLAGRRPAGGPATQRVRSARSRSAAAVFGLAMLVFAGAPTLLSAFPIALLVGGASIAFMTASTSIVQIRAEPQMRGRVLALQAMVFLGSTPIGGPLLGLAVRHLRRPLRARRRRRRLPRRRRLGRLRHPGAPAPGGDRTPDDDVPASAGRPAHGGRRTAATGRLAFCLSPTGCRRTGGRVVSRPPGARRRAWRGRR